MADTRDLARLLFESFCPGLVVALNGELGSGKTTLVREFLRGFGVESDIRSPTYTFLECYPIELGFDVLHFDLYRLNGADEWFLNGFDETINSDSIVFIEWFERISTVVEQDISIDFEFEGSSRNLFLSANTPVGNECLNSLADHEEK